MRPREKKTNLVYLGTVLEGGRAEGEREKGRGGRGIERQRQGHSNKEQEKPTIYIPGVERGATNNK